MIDVTVVTGAASGMGLASAERLRAHPGELVLVDLRAEALVPIAQRLDARSFACDVTDPVRVAALADEVASIGSLRRLVHAAGISPTMASPLHIFDVDLRGTALLIEAFDPLVVPGSVGICFASIAAETLASAGDPVIDPILDDPLASDFLDRISAVGAPIADDPSLAYAWAKRGVQRLVRRTAVSWGPRGGRIVSISPGMIDTPMGMQEADAQPMMTFMLEHTPVGRMGSASELAATVEFLCSDEASFITGIDLTVDGGVMAGLERLAK